MDDRDGAGRRMGSKICKNKLERVIVADLHFREGTLIIMIDYDKQQSDHNES